MTQIPVVIPGKKNISAVNLANQKRPAEDFFK